MVDESVVKNIRKYLGFLEDEGLPVRFGIVFGSQVNGETHEWSDIDLVVVSPRFDGERERRELVLLWRAARMTDNRIEPIPCGEKQWEEDGVSPVIIIARREGVRVNLEKEFR